MENARRVKILPGIEAAFQFAQILVIMEPGAIRFELSCVVVNSQWRKIFVWLEFELVCLFGDLGIQ